VDWVSGTEDDVAAVPGKMVTSVRASDVPELAERLAWLSSKDPA
jgi:hypothetical protein